MAEVQKIALRTSRCGAVNVFIHGNHLHATNKAVFLTVHDFGSNALSFDNFIMHESMVEIRQRSIWINFEVPGQGLDAPDLPSNFEFPSLQAIGEDLDEVLTKLNIQYVIGFGEGAGANILTRFAIAFPTRIIGLILLHPTATSAGWSEWVKEKFRGRQLLKEGFTPTTEDYLVLYKFGTKLDELSGENRDATARQYLADLHVTINPKNLMLYMQSFLNRNDLTNILREKVTCDVLVVCGTKSSFHHTVVTMFSNLNSQKATLLDLVDVGDALNEAPERVVRAMLLFCKGLGLFASVQMPGEKSRNVSLDTGVPEGRRRISMQEADVPRHAL